MAKVYKLGYVYKYSCPTFEDFYIGSTVDFNTRFSKHKTHFRDRPLKHTCLKFYDFIRDNDSHIKDWNMEIIETLNDITLNQLRKKEQHFMNELKPTLNKFKAFATKEYKLEYHRKAAIIYKLKHPEKIREMQNEYHTRRFECSCGSNVMLSHKLRHLNTKKHKDLIKNLK